jgi:serine/threonine protein kinase/Tfp pilus assembly protein PilF
MKTNPPGSARASRADDGAPAIASATAQSVCAQCGSRLDSDIGGDKFCIHCLLRSALDQDDNDPGKRSRRSDQLLQGTDRASTEFGDYELLEELGRGSQGVVYRARQKSLHRTVALKVVAYGQWASQAHLKRFRREAEAAASLDHPCIVPIYEVGERDGSCYFSMKFVEGGQLDEVVRRAPLSIRQSTELIAKVARTVHHAHEHGILHRDIKPGNILLDEKGEPHLTDFGLARLVEADSTVTRTREVLGTPSYMAPEQAAGETTKLGKATDVYGLGAVLYQLLTGHPPFAGGTSYETIQLLLNTEPRKPRVLNRRIDRDLSTICLKCLEKEPQRRYSSAFDLAEDLEHWLKHEPIYAKRSGFFTHARKWVRRKPAIAALIILLIAFAATLGWIVWKSEFIPAPIASGVAVLPFENLSGDPDNAYFADGIQEEILTRLASIADLKVISRTSTQRYHSKPGNLAGIAKQLGVANIVEGSVQKAADQVRVNVQLINAQTDSHLWADTFDRKLTDIFGVESEIAKAIAGALQAKLTRRDEQGLAVKPTNNPEAYDAYLHGLSIERNRYSNTNYQDAAKAYARAIQLDPTFAIAWARLAVIRSFLYFNSVNREVNTPKAVQEAADRAMALAPEAGESWTAKGAYRYRILRDFEGAVAAYQEAQKRLPNSSFVLQNLASVQRRVGRWQDAEASFTKALAVDPLDVSLLSVMGGEFYCPLRRFDQALALFDRELTIAPDSETAHSDKASVLQHEGRLAEAAQELAHIAEDSTDDFVVNSRVNQALYERDFNGVIRVVERKLNAIPPGQALDSNTKFALAQLGYCQEWTGRHADAQQSFNRAIASIKPTAYTVVAPYAGKLPLALAYAGLGQRQEALEQAQQAIKDFETDAISEPRAEIVLAQIQARFGDHDAAIAALPHLLEVPAGVTTADLKFNPFWDPLRTDPRFQKLCEEKQQ